MKTSDFRFSLSASQLNETLQQKFGGSIDIDNFDPTQLVKAAKLIESKMLAFKQDGFNATLENEEFYKLKLMQDIVHTRMRELVRESKKEKMSKAAKGTMKYGKDKKKTVKEGFWGGALGAGLGTLAAGEWNPWAAGGGYLIGSKAADDIFGEGVDDSHRALAHAVMYRKHHHEGDLDSAHHHKTACAECGGQVWHGDMGECWHMHPSLGDGQPHNIDEGIGKYLLPAAGLVGAGYLYNNPETLTALKGHAGRIAGPMLQGAGSGIMNAGNALRNDDGGFLDAVGSGLNGVGSAAIDAGNAIMPMPESLMEGEESMCELAMHHATEYFKSHKMGNLKHSQHHRDNVEECGGKIWHDGTGSAYFSHHDHNNGIPHRIDEFSLVPVGSIGGGIGGAVLGSKYGKLAGPMIAGATGVDPETAGLIGQYAGGALGGMAGGEVGRRAGKGLDAAVSEEGSRKKMKKKDLDQDNDGDNDFADVQIARMKKSGMDKKKAVAKTKDKSYNKESVDRILKESIRFYLREGEEGKAEVIMAVKDMVDKFTGWSEDIAQMQANTAMEMADSIRDELGSNVSAQFTQVAGPALDSAFQAVKAAREALNSIVGIITGEGQAPGSMGGMPAPGGMPGGMPGAPAAGGMPGAPAAGAMPPLAPEDDEEDTTGRAKRESVERSLRIAKLLVGR